MLTVLLFAGVQSASICYLVVIVQHHVDKSSKHCRACAKCTLGFDHHCVWLNCCIGERNYWQFFSLLASFFLLLAFQACADMIMLVWAVSGEEDDGTGISPACTVVRIRMFRTLVFTSTYT